MPSWCSTREETKLFRRHMRITVMSLLISAWANQDSKEAACTFMVFVLTMRRVRPLFPRKSNHLLCGMTIRSIKRPSIWASNIMGPSLWRVAIAGMLSCGAARPPLMPGNRCARAMPRWIRKRGCRVCSSGSRRALTLVGNYWICGETEAARWLLEAGADPYAYDQQGWVPLHYVVSVDDAITLEAIAPFYEDLNVLTLKENSTRLVTINKAHQDTLALALAAHPPAHQCVRFLNQWLASSQSNQ